MTKDEIVEELSPYHKRGEMGHRALLNAPISEFNLKDLTALRFSLLQRKLADLLRH